MFFGKYYSFKDKENIYKIVLSLFELKILKGIIEERMTDIDYNKLYVKRFDAEAEYKFKDSPNFIGEEVLDVVKKSPDPYYVFEVNASELFELFERFFDICRQYRSLCNAHYCYIKALEANTKDFNKEFEDSLKELLQETKKFL